MWLPIIGLILGFLVILFSRVEFPLQYASYISVGILAGLDTIFGGVKASIEGNFDYKIFVSGFFANTVLAGLLAYLGDLIGVEGFYMAAVVAFGVRIFNNIAFIRRDLLARLEATKQRK